MPSRHSHAESPDRVSSVQRLVQWFTSNGGELSPDVEIVFSPSTGYHCRALRSLTSAVVAKCPLSLTLSYLNLDHTQSIVPHVKSPLVDCLGQIPNHVLTYLLLIDQLLDPIKEHLDWYPYIACLPDPDSMTTPLWFDAEEMQCLAGTNLAHEIHVKISQLTRELDMAKAVLRRVGIDDDIYTAETFRWAAAIMSSRAFISTHIIPDKETFPILFPVVDILNHSPTAKVEWDFHPLQDFSLKILDHEQVRPGDEIYNNYAPKQNDELLLGYGFCIPDNPVEQFAIRMRVDPDTEQASRTMKMLEPDNVPFDMNTSFLTADVKDEPYYLRPKGHPFGRYQNRVPFFRAIPPSIIHMFYVKALMNLDLHPKDIQVNSPPSRVVLEILLIASQAMTKKSEALPLPLHAQRNFRSDKLKYATIYRDGQAKIIHAIRDELETVISNLRIREQALRRPGIISTTEILALLSTDFPSYYTHFKAGFENQYEVSLSSWKRYSADIAAMAAGSYPAELAAWKLILCLCHVIYQKNASATDEPRDGVRSLILDWVEYLVSQTAVPDTPAPMEAEMLHEFILGWKEDAAVVERAYSWADDVADKFAFQLNEQVGKKEVERICMYVEVLETSGNEAWMYEDGDGDAQVR